MKKWVIGLASAVGLTVSGCITEGVGYIDSSYFPPPVIYESPRVYYEPAPVIIPPPVIITPPLRYRDNYRERHREPVCIRPAPPIYRHHPAPPIYRHHSPPPHRQYFSPPPIFRHHSPNVHRGHR